jgi:triacylglycerol lipase
MMRLRPYIRHIVAICAMFSFLGAGIAAACSGVGGGGGGGCLAPSVSTGSATGITSNSATLNGSVNPQGCETTYTFEYGRSSEGYPNSIGSFAGSGTFSEAVSTHSPLGLQPSTSYHFRLSASNAGGTTTGGSSSFTTTGSTEACSKPTVTTEPATVITEASALLVGSVNPRGCLTTYAFEWGPSSSPTSYPNSTPIGTAGSGTLNVSVQNSISGLQSSKGYHFRLSASNSIGMSYGSDKPFTTAPQTHDPILFVHGWEGNETAFATFANWFQQDGWPASRLYRWSYNTNQSNAVTAQEISSRVNTILATTGAPKVDIVTHSMGALSSRYYLKNLGGTSKVEDWVSLGGPNHGTAMIQWCFYTACEEMKPDSTFLQALNAGDETPGAVRYATWKSDCDGVVMPPSSVEVGGAIQNLWTSCLIHTELHEDFPTYKAVKEFIK